METIYDAAVIGGGPGGYSAAIRIAQLGGKAVLFEKGSMGGTCLNVGCIPTKYLLDKAGLLEKIRKNTENGVLRDAGAFSWKKIQKEKDQVVRQLSAGIEGILKSYGVKIVKDTARCLRPGVVETASGGEVYKTRNIILATGAEAVLPKIRGLSAENALDSTSALALEEIPQRLVILGGGVIGVEFASIFAAFGSEVTILEMLPGILGLEDSEMTCALRRELEKRGIRIYTGAVVEEVSESSGIKTVKFIWNGETRHLGAERILAAAGRRPCYGGIDPEKLGIAMDERQRIRVDETMETSVKGIYAVGDMSGGLQLAHVAYAQAETAAANCMNRGEKVFLERVPRCVYSLPQMASVGLAEEEIKKRNVAYEKSVYPCAASGKAVASGETDGFVKVLCEKESGKIIGVHMLGNEATELISAAVVAMNFNAAAQDFSSMIFPHPTLSELMKESVLSVRKEAIHIPKKPDFPERSVVP